ncbi:tyrosyl-DNA phosphodiesterase 1 [Naviculisporaceae sp. PSN 640]
MVSPRPPNGMEDEEDEAIRIAIALSLGEDPDAPPLGTPPRPTELSRARDARERAQERQRIRIRDQARDAELDRRERDVLSHPAFDYQSFHDRINARPPVSARREPPPAETKNRVTVDLTLDSDDDDVVDDSNDARAVIKPAIEEEDPSKAKNEDLLQNRRDAERDEAVEDKNGIGAQASVTTSGPGGGVIGGILGGLDRKKMEEERLARLGKRKASELTGGPKEENDRAMKQRAGPMHRSALVNSGVYQRQKLDWPRTDSPASLTSLPSLGSSGQAPSRSSNFTTNNERTSARNTSNVPFPRGVVKKTWSRSQPRLGDDIKIEEVFQKEKLRLAVLSSYQWDDEWIETKLDMANTKVVFIAFAANDAEKELMESNVSRARVRFCFPRMQNIGAMHSKLQLLKYDDYLRIVVPTGNLVPYDWGETGTMENMVFIIDLPKLEGPNQERATLTTFGQDLSYFLTEQGLDDRLVESLKKYDFSETERYGFVHSICGSQGAGEAWRKSGYCALGRVVKGLGLGSQAPIEVDYVCASLGAINDSLLNAIYYACQGDDGLKEYQSRTARAKGREDRVVRDHTRVYYPSDETVRQSRGGRNHAGTICFQSRYYEAPTFPAEVLRDCKSTRTGLLMHSKIIFARLPNEPSRSPTRPGGFFYLGSANLSESAWGRLVRERGSGELKMTCRNWECGVVLPADSYRDEHGQDTWKIFQNTVPVPMEHPAAPLTEDGPLRPWFGR